MSLDSTGNSSHFMYNLTFAFQKYGAGLLVSVLIGDQKPSILSYQEETQWVSWTTVSFLGPIREQRVQNKCYLRTWRDQ